MCGMVIGGVQLELCPGGWLLGAALNTALEAGRE